MNNPSGYTFNSHQHLSTTMNAIPWYRYLMVFIIFLLVLKGSYGCLAETTPFSTPGAASDVSGLIDTSETPTVRATIAPIHTKEPEVRPPVINPDPGTTITPVITQTPRPTPTPTPTVTSIPVDTGNNETAMTYYQWGRAYKDIGNCEAAIAEFDKAIAREPYFAEAWYQRSDCYERLGMYDEAYDSYRFLMTIDPSFFESGRNITSDIPANITSQLRPVLPEPVPFTSTAVFWIIIGIGVGGLGISGYVLYHMRKRPALNSHNMTRKPAGPVSAEDLEMITDQVTEYYDGDREILKLVIKLAIEIAREGREGKPVGTAFILGDSDAVLLRSRQLILNPLAGHSKCERMITNPDIRENLKELSILDGAFVIREDGIVEAAGRYISIDTSKVELSKGFGTRHVSVAAITQETKAVGVVVSESGGLVRIMAKGRIVLETS